MKFQQFLCTWELIKCSQDRKITIKHLEVSKIIRLKAVLSHGEMRWLVYKISTYNRIKHTRPKQQLNPCSGLFCKASSIINTFLVWKASRVFDLSPSTLYLQETACEPCSSPSTHRVHILSIDNQALSSLNINSPSNTAKPILHSTDEDRSHSATITEWGPPKWKKQVCKIQIECLLKAVSSCAQKNQCVTLEDHFDFENMIRGACYECQPTNKKLK